MHSIVIIWTRNTICLAFLGPLVSDWHGHRDSNACIGGFIHQQLKKEREKTLTFRGGGCILLVLIVDFPGVYNLFSNDDLFVVLCTCMNRRCVCVWMRNWKFHINRYGNPLEKCVFVALSFGVVRVKRRKKKVPQKQCHCVKMWLGVHSNSSSSHTQYRTTQIY